MRFKVTAQSGQGTGVALSPDGTTIATVGAEGLTLLDARDGALLASPRGLGALRSLAFSVDGRFIATGGEDNRTTIWEAATGRPVRSVGGSDAAPITGVAFSPDGALLATADEAGLLKTYTVALDPLEAIGRAQITRELTDAECS
jgi:WD40 repeat protein